MATRLKGNKGYFTLLGWETTYSSVQLGLSLALINLPLALAAAGIDFAANVISGLIMGPKTAAPPREQPATPPEKKTPLQSAKGLGKKIWTYQKSCFVDPAYTVGASAAGAGMSVFFQGALGIQSLLATHNITVVAGVLSITGVSLPLGLTICSGMIGLGLFSIVAGNMDKWRGLSKYYHKAFRKEEPPTARKSNLKKFSEHPRMSKIFNSPIAKALNKTLLIGMTVESSLFSIAAASSVIVQRGAAFLASPKKALADLAPLGWACVWGWRGVWQLTSAGRLLLRNVFGKKPKDAAASEQTASNTAPVALQPAAPQSAAPQSPLADKTITETFEKSASKEAAQNATAQQAAQDLQKPRPAPKA